MNKKTEGNFSGIEIRSFGEDAAPKLAEEGSRKVTGYAIVFNRPSRVLYDPVHKRRFVEVIEPRAVTEEFLRNCDIKMTRNHDDDALLARSRFGAGTLNFEIDEYGVRYTFDMPQSPTGDDTLELIRRGDLFGSSFKFVDASDGVRVERLKDEKNMYKRTVTKFADIRDFSIVTDPAYYGTSVSARSLEEATAEDDSWKQILAEQCKGIDMV